jgi:predicted AlkP superfamily phosphohydrolase/phosphomutase
MDTLKHLPILFRIARAAAMAAVLSMGACKGGGGGEATQPEAQRVAFDSFAEFVKEKGAEGTPAHQVVFVGVDGATWRVLTPLIEEGRLPNLARMEREGSYGTLLSTPCYVSPPAWSSMHCGYAPSKSGVYTFGKFSWETREFSSVTAQDLRVPSAWDVASQAGRKVAVTNMPLTYPVHPINGIMVSGLMTPVPVADRLAISTSRFSGGLQLPQVAPGLASFSTPLKIEGSDAYNTIVLFIVDSTNDRTKNYDRVVLTIFPRLESEPSELAGPVYTFDVGEWSPWLGVRAVWNDEVRDGWCKLRMSERPGGEFVPSMSQVLFDVREAVEQYTYPKELADELAQRFGYYMPSKFLKQEVVPAITMEGARYGSFFYDYDDWDVFYYVFTQTDNIQHLEGFSSNTAEVYEIIDRFLGDLMSRLPEDCTLIVASDHGFKEFKWGIDVNEALEQVGLVVRKPGGDEIDFGQTTVFHNLWHLYFNPALVTREHLAALGVPVEGGEDPRAALMRYLQGTEVVAADGQHRIHLRFTPSGGDPARGDPDMVVEGAYDDYLVEFWNLKRPRGSTIWDLMPSEANNHEREGVYLLWGNRVKAGTDAGTRNIEDIAPTILYLSGLPIAADMDGRVIFDALRDDFVSRNPQFVIPDYSEIRREFVAAEEDREPFEKKLRSLGYVH